jgi:uncharacterized protein (TIGR02145 family)
MKYRLLFGLFSALVLILLNISCCKNNEEPRKGKSNAIFNPDKTYDTVKDIDGNEYKTIIIGTQTWMAENLRVTHYRNGDPIPNITDNTQWGIQTAGAYCSYKNTKDVDSIATHGLLYNGYAVTDSRGLAPEGWHLPTDAEWTTLTTYVDGNDGVTNEYGSNIAGGRLKEAGTLHWGRANHADNSSGFTALPSGIRNTYQGSFCFISYSGSYWSSSEYFSPFLLIRDMSPDFTSIARGQSHRASGNSIRCIKD